MKRHLVKLVLVFSVLALAAQAQAIPITPETVPELFGNQNDQPAINAIVLPYIFPSTELYKNEIGPEEGPLEASYQTSFSNGNSDALIEYVGGEFVGPIAYLLVKDGNAEPNWFLFNLTSLFGWNGTDDLVLSGFFPGTGHDLDKGSISHVTLYGGSTPVPEPGTMMLLGSGLVGLAGWGRKKFRK